MPPVEHERELLYNWPMRTYGAVNLSVLLFLIALNVVLFIITLLRPEEMIEYLALTPALVPERPWTIISSMFVHGGFGHILFNMLALYFLGSFVIRAAGDRVFLAVFFLGGIAGSMLYFLLGQLVLQNALPPIFGNPWTPAVGASGAIFGLAGTLAIIVPRVPVIIFPIPIPMPLWVAILIFSVVLILLPIGIPTSIGWQAHLGGLALGLIAGLVFRRRRRIYYF